MKRLFKILAIAVAGAAVLSSCSKDQVTATYSPMEGDGGYSFGAPSTLNFEFSSEKPVMSIDVYRATTEGTATVQVSSTQMLGDQAVSVLDVPTELSFEDGSGKAVLQIGYNESIQPATNYSITVTLANVTPGGNQSVSFTASLAYTWVSLGTEDSPYGQLYDNLAYGVDLDGDGYLTGPEEFNLQDVEVLKADGYDRWRIINPWGNREGIATSWGSSAVLSEYSQMWEFYIRTDIGNGSNVRWDGSVIPGILYESLGEQIVYQMPSDVNAAAYGQMDEAIGFMSDDIVQLNPAASIENTTSWFGQVNVILGFPGVDLAAALGLY